VGECFFWYRLTQVVPEKIPESHKMAVCVCVLHARFWLHAFLFFSMLFVFFDDTIVKFQCNGEQVRAVVESLENAMSGTVQAVRE